MLLQDAIILGDTLKKSNPWTWISADGSCGCAFGGALLAAGIAEAYKAERQQIRIHESLLEHGQDPQASLPPLESKAVKNKWPWLTEEHLVTITDLYWDVYRKAKTIEDVAAYVRSVEPITPSAVKLDEEKVLAVV